MTVHTPLHEFLNKSIQDWKCHSKGICQTKTKGKKSFCELGLPEDQNVTGIWKEELGFKKKKRSSRETETNRTKLEHFVNVHQNHI